MNHELDGKRPARGEASHRRSEIAAGRADPNGENKRILERIQVKADARTRLEKVNMLLSDENNPPWDNLVLEERRDRALLELEQILLRFTCGTISYSEQQRQISEKVTFFSTEPAVLHWLFDRDGQHMNRVEALKNKLVPNFRISGFHTRHL